MEEEMEFGRDVAIFKQLTGEYAVGVVKSLEASQAIAVTHYTHIELSEDDGTIWAFPIAVPLQGIDTETIGDIETIVPRGSYLFYSLTPLDSAHPFVKKFKEFWGL